MLVKNRDFVTSVPLSTDLLPFVRITISSFGLTMPTLLSQLKSVYIKLGSLSVLIRRFPRSLSETNALSLEAVVHLMLQDILIQIVTFLQCYSTLYLERNIFRAKSRLLDCLSFNKVRYEKYSLETLIRLVMSDQRLLNLSMYRYGKVLKTDIFQNVNHFLLSLPLIEEHCTLSLARMERKSLLRNLNNGFCASGIPLIFPIRFSLPYFLHLKRQMRVLPKNSSVFFMSPDEYFDFLPSSVFRSLIISEELNLITKEKNTIISCINLNSNNNLSH